MSEKDLTGARIDSSLKNVCYLPTVPDSAWNSILQSTEQTFKTVNSSRKYPRGDQMTDAWHEKCPLCCFYSTLINKHH